MAFWSSTNSVSIATRLNRVYPQIPSATYGTVPFIWQLRTEFPWFVATNNGIQIISNLTSPL